MKSSSPSLGPESLSSAQHTLTMVLGVLMVFACGPSTDTAVSTIEAGSSTDTIAASSSELPLLILSGEFNNPDRLDLGRFSRIAVSREGVVVFVSPQESRALQARHLDGEVVTFSVVGDGPGEVRDPLVLGVSASGYVVADRSNSKITTFAANGDPIRDVRVTVPLLPGPARLDSATFLVRLAIGDPSLIGVLDLASGSITPFPIQSDSFVKAHWPDVESILTNLPAIGALEDGVLIADRKTYEFAIFNLHGDRLAAVAHVGHRQVLDEDGLKRLEAGLGPETPRAKQRAETINKRGVPWFTPTIRLDDKGRSWFVGEVGEDSAFADVFAGVRYVGRYTLPCKSPGSYWDMCGQWLALVCAPSNPDANDDAVVKLYRIAGQ